MQYRGGRIGLAAMLRVSLQTSQALSQKAPVFEIFIVVYISMVAWSDQKRDFRTVLSNVLWYLAFFTLLFSVYLPYIGIAEKVNTEKFRLNKLLA